MVPNLFKTLFRRTIAVEIPAGMKLYINFYDVEIAKLQFIMMKMLTIEIKNEKKWSLHGKIPTHLEVYGPYRKSTECIIAYSSIDVWLPHKSKFHIGIYARQILLPLGDCGNINLL